MNVDRVSAELVCLGSLSKLRKSGLPCADPHLQLTPRYMRIDDSGVRVRRPLLIASARWKTEVDFCPALLLTSLFPDASF